MIFRPQRGGITQSMKEKVILLSSKAALAKHLRVPIKSVDVRWYGDDAWNGWRSTYLIIVDGNAVGFTNQEPV